MGFMGSDWIEETENRTKLAVYLYNTGKKNVEKRTEESVRFCSFFSSKLYLILIYGEVKCVCAVHIIYLRGYTISC